MLTAIRILFARRAYHRAVKSIPHPYGSNEYASASIAALANYMQAIEYRVHASARP